MTSEDEYQEEYTPRVRDTVAKINAASKFNKLHQDLNPRRDSVPKKNSIPRGSTGKRNTIESNKSFRFSYQDDDDTCPMPTTAVKHSSHKEGLKSFGRFNKLYQDVRKQRKTSIGAYKDTDERRKSREEDGTRRFSAVKNSPSLIATKLQQKCMDFENSKKITSCFQSFISRSETPVRTMMMFIANIRRRKNKGWINNGELIVILVLGLH